MAIKKSLFVLLVPFMIGGFLSCDNGVAAETLKLQISTVVTKVEQFPIENIEGTVLASLVKDGVFVLENGNWEPLNSLALLATRQAKAAHF